MSGSFHAAHSLVAIGSNLADAAGRAPLEVGRAAVAALKQVAGLRVVAVSSWYRTAPVPVSDQPDFINGVVLLEGVIAPTALLAVLQGLEAAAGRQRWVTNAARVLDLDIIDMGGVVRERPDPILPHPRAHQRAFVLAPLADVAPGWRHPVLHCGAGDLLRALGEQHICMVPGTEWRPEA